MRRAAALAACLAVSAVTFYVACGSDSGASATTASDGGPASDAGGSAPDAPDPRCATQAVFLDTHPHASAQPTDLGKTISDTRGWNGQLYFAYGDLEANTGPIVITSFDPKAKKWIDHPISYRESGTGLIKTTDSFPTHDIERFLLVAGQLWAPAAQEMGTPPFDTVTSPEYAVGSASHDWSEVDIAPSGLHIVDTIERAPGDIYVTGSMHMYTDASAAANGRAGSAIWRSQDGGPFTQLFPDFTPRTDGEEFFDLTGAFMYGAALKGVAYFDGASFIYKYDGANWDFNEAFGEFLSPAVFAGHLVFADLGQFYAFDGTKRTNLEFRFFESQGRYQGLKETLALFQVTEGRLLAVKYGGDVMMTTDLQTWTCIGKAPADATSIGSLDGVVYFGAIEGKVYGFPAPSW
jgi:hypothetical protein